jgi:hypothetical protein
MGHAIHILVFAPEGQMNVIKECIALICPMLQMGGGEKNTHDFLVMVEHVESTLQKVFNPLAPEFSLKF